MVEETYNISVDLYHWSLNMIESSPSHRTQVLGSVDIQSTTLRKYRQLISKSIKAPLVYITW